MKLRIKEDSSYPVKLELVYIPYERYRSNNSPKSVTITGTDLLNALSKMADRMLLYIDSNEIEEEGYTAEDVLDNIISSNGDGCDYIIFLKNLTTGEVYIEEPVDEEEW